MKATEILATKGIHDESTVQNDEGAEHHWNSDLQDGVQLSPTHAPATSGLLRPAPHLPLRLDTGHRPLACELLPDALFLPLVYDDEAHDHEEAGDDAAQEPHVDELQVRGLGEAAHQLGEERGQDEEGRQRHRHPVGEVLDVEEVGEVGDDEQHARGHVGGADVVDVLVAQDELQALGGVVVQGQVGHEDVSHDVLVVPLVAAEAKLVDADDEQIRGILG